MLIEFYILQDNNITAVQFELVTQRGLFRVQGYFHGYESKRNCKLKYIINA